VIREVAPAPALRPAGKPEREPGRTERATTESTHGAAAGLYGPTGRRHNRDTEPATGLLGRPATSEVQAMQTITKLRNKIERASALNGWRMRWHMQ
jgi:hypothetical protein